MFKKLCRFIESKRIAYMVSINNSSYQQGVNDICKCIADEVLRLEKSHGNNLEVDNSTSHNTPKFAIQEMITVLEYFVNNAPLEEQKWMTERLKIALEQSNIC